MSTSVRYVIRYTGKNKFDESTTRTLQYHDERYGWTDVQDEWEDQSQKDRHANAVKRNYERSPR